MADLSNHPVSMSGNTRQAPSEKKPSKLVPWFVLANVAVWSGFFLVQMAKPGGMLGDPVHRLDSRYDPKADYSRGCGENTIRSGNVCVDRYEFPNRAGRFPELFDTAEAAQAACNQVGKRLCTLGEFSEACSAPSDSGDFSPRNMMLACNIVSQFSERPVRAAKSGEHSGCVTRTGLNDAIGNLAEWVVGPSGPALSGGSFASIVGTETTCRLARMAGPGLGKGKRGVRCCREAPGNVPSGH